LISLPFWGFLYAKTAERAYDHIDAVDVRTGEMGSAVFVFGLFED
jgi:hypothetical protein